MRACFFSFLMIVALAASTALAQDPEVRAIARDPATSGSPVLDRTAVAALFPEGTPAQVPAWLAAGEAGTCQTELAAWVAANPDHPQLAEARFLLGYCAHEAGSHDMARDLLGDAMTSLPLVADLAGYLAADSAFQAGAYEEAIAHTLLLPEDSVYGPRAQFLRGRAMRRGGRTLEAVGVLSDFANRYPRAAYIADVELELAAAQADSGAAVEAARLYHRISVRYPGSSQETAAAEALAALLPSLPEDVRGELSALPDADLLARATALFDRHRSEQVIELLTPELPRLAGTALGCEANFLVGKSYTKLRRHNESVPFYEAIVEGGCEPELVVKALYNAGQGLWNADRDAEGAAMFRRLYTEHAASSYADDALLYEARIERSNGNTERYLELLEQQVRQFPEGDMLGDANWLLFEHELTSGDLAGAVDFADALGARTGENSLYNRGRIAYFRARALEQLGRVAEAAEGYEQVTREVPLSYYALLALNRLSGLNPMRTRELVDALRTSSGAATAGVPVEPAQLAENVHFRRGLLLLRLGLLEPARREFDRLTEAYPNQDGPLWLVSFLFDAAGAYHISHDIPRRQIESFLSSYPTAETAEHWHLAYPRPFLEDVTAAAEARGLDPHLVYSIMREESGFNPRAESWANAMGLMQLMQPTAESMAERVGIRRLRTRDLFDAETSISLGSEYLAVLAARYGRHPALTIAGYNGGEGNVDRWVSELGALPLDRFVEEIPYRQTRDYTKRVLMTYWIYTWLYAEDPLLAVPFEVPRSG